MDVDPLEVVAIARVGLHLGLCSGTRQGQRRLDTGFVLELHQPADRPEVGEILGG